MTGSVRSGGVTTVSNENEATGDRLLKLVVALAWVTIAIVSVGHVVGVVQRALEGDVERIGLDYRAFIAAGELVRSGNASLLYEPFSDAFLRLADVGFVYPPWAALVFVPWSLVPVLPGLIAWTAAGLAFMVWSLHRAGVRSPVFIVAVFVSFPSVFALGLGQSAFFLVGLVALAFAASIRHREADAGVAIGLAAWKPHLLGGFALLAFARPRAWARTAVAAVGTTLVLVIGSTVLLPGSWRSWIEFLAGSVDDLASSVMEASLPGLVGLASGSLTPWRFVAVVAVAVVVIPLTVMALRRTEAGLAEQLALALAVWILLMPHVVVYDVLVLAVPLGVLLGGPYRRDVIAVGTLLAFCLSVGPSLTEIQVDAYGRAIDLSAVGLILATVAFGAWVVRSAPLLGTTPGSVPAHDESDRTRDRTVAP